MRLIDADKLKDDLIGRGDYHIANVVVDRQSPVCDIEQIRTEIEAHHMGDSLNVCVKAWNEAIEKVLQILDKYTKWESK